MKVLIPQDVATIGKDFLRSKGYELKIGSGFDEATIVREVEDCQAILCRTYPITRKIMESGAQLKVISRHGVGVNLIDLTAATELGIQVTNAPLSNMEAVAEHIMALILACSKQIPIMDYYVRNGQWEEKRNDSYLTELGGKTIGIIGMGRIGQSLAKKCALGFDMRVLAYTASGSKPGVDDYIEFMDSMEKVFAQSDIISLSLPANAETENLIDMRLFRLMKKNAIFINCARGEIVNQADLYIALQSGVIRCAGVDVLWDEPPQSDNKLLSLKNVIFTPHSAALTVESIDKMALHAAIGIHEVLSGQIVSWPVNKINSFAKEE